MVVIMLDCRAPGADGGRPAKGKLAHFSAISFTDLQANWQLGPVRKRDGPATAGRTGATQPQGWSARWFFFQKKLLFPNKLVKFSSRSSGPVRAGSWSIFWPTFCTAAARRPLVAGSRRLPLTQTRPSLIFAAAAARLAVAQNGFVAPHLWPTPQARTPNWPAFAH